MYEYSRRSVKKSKGLQLHAVLREFKKFQQEKHILQNRINIMHNNQVKNKNRTKIIQDHLSKIKYLHDHRKQQKRNLSEQILKQIDKSVLKKKQGIKKIKEEKKNILISKNTFREHKLKNVWRIRSESQINVSKIAEKKEELLKTNKLRKQRVNENESLGRTRVEIFKQKRLSQLKEQQNSKLVSQISLNQNSKMQVSALQKLQKEMVMQYSESLKSLETSRAKFKRASMMRI